MDQVQVVDLQSAFNTIDKDLQGSIQIEQFPKLMLALNEQLSEDQVNEITSKLQPKEYGKISFLQFKFWWEHVYKGSLGEFANVKSKIDNSTSKFIGKYAEEGFNIQMLEQTDKVNHLSIEASVKGEKNQGVQINLEAHIAGNKGIQKSAELATKYNLNKNSVNFVIVLTATNENQAAQSINKLITDVLKGQMFHKILSSILKTEEVSEKLKEMNNDYYCIKTQVVDSKVVISIQIFQKLLQLLDTPIQIINNCLSQLKAESVFSASVNFTSNFSLEDLFEKSLVEALSMGANLQIKSQFAQALVLKLRQYLVISGKAQIPIIPPIIVLLLKNLSLKFNLKSPSMIDNFFQKLGITLLLEQLPTLPQILEQVALFGVLVDLKTNEQHYLHLGYRFLELLNKHSIQNYSFFVQHKDYFISAHIALPNFLQIFKVIFNQI